MKERLAFAIVVASAIALLIGSQNRGPARASVPTPVANVYLPVVMKMEPPATATPTATALPSPTPTATPTSDLTRVVEPAESWNPATIAIVPGAQWAVTKIRMLDPCENHMMEIAFVAAEDASGRPLDGVTVRFRAGDIVLDIATGDKGPGQIEFPMNVPMNLSAWVIADERGSMASDMATNMENLHVFDNDNIPGYYRICQTTGLEGNAPKHLSYAVTFRRIR